MKIMAVIIIQGMGIVELADIERGEGSGRKVVVQEEGKSMEKRIIERLVEVPDVNKGIVVIANGNKEGKDDVRVLHDSIAMIVNLVLIIQMNSDILINHIIHYFIHHEINDLINDFIAIPTGFVLACGNSRRRRGIGGGWVEF